MIDRLTLQATLQGPLRAKKESTQKKSEENDSGEDSY
jgi:hypothetical protein